MELLLLAGAAFSAGLLGSPHCAGMCGGIIAAFNTQMPIGQRSQYVALYHLGRLTSYALLGLLVSLLGGLVLNQLQGVLWPRWLLAAAFILVGLMITGVAKLAFMERAGLQLWAKLAPVRQKLLPINTLPRAYGAGLMWGLLPCGLVYGALALVTTVNGPTAMLLMLCFGMGTLPVLLAMQPVLQRLQSGFVRKYVRMGLGLSWVLVGLWLLVFSMGGHDHSGHAGHKASIDHLHMNHAEPMKPIENMDHHQHMDHGQPMQH